MDIRLILLLLVFAVLMVAFGNNPMEHKSDGKDSFQKSLEETLEKNNKEAAMDTMPSTGSNGFMQSVTGSTYAHPMPGSAPIVGGATVTGGGMRLPGLPGVATSSATPARQPSMQAKSAATAPGGQQAPAFFLKDGRQVFFSGYQVFLMGKDGNLEPLPDGTYSLQSGDKVVIRDGARVAE